MNRSNKDMMIYELLDSKYVIKTPAGAIDSKTEGSLTTDLYIPPYGPKQINEVMDYTAGKGYTVGYHYGETGAETFTVIKGSVQIVMNGKRFMLEEGDIFNVEAWCPYSMTFMEEGTVVREMCTNRSNKEYDLPEPAKVVEVAKESVREVSPKGRGIYEYSAGGIRFVLKTGRWQLGGLKEVWELCIDCGRRIEYGKASESAGLYMVRSGRFQIEVDGRAFIADFDDGDLIHIPAGTAYSITALSKDCVIQDFNVTCHLFRLLEMIEAAQDYFPDKLKDQDYMHDLLEVNQAVHFKDVIRFD